MTNDEKLLLTKFIDNLLSQDSLKECDDITEANHLSDRDRYLLNRRWLEENNPVAVGSEKREISLNIVKMLWEEAKGQI